MVLRRSAAWLGRVLGLFTTLLALGAPAQQPPAGRVVLVLPFENRSGNASLGWVGDSFPDTLNARLSSAGFLTISHDDRLYAYNHLGLPEDFRPSRATTIRIAQQLDANFVIIGNFTTAPNTASNPGVAASGDRIIIQAQVLDIDALKLSPPVEDSADLTRLYDAENAIAWKIARVLQPNFNVAEQTFLAESGAVPLSAFEDYIRGITAPSQAEQLQRLKNAVTLQPSYAPALLALGKEQYAARDYASAAATLAHVPVSSPLALEGNFYLGLASFNMNNYAAAENAFAFVAARLPLPEVLNNEAVAMSRQNKDAVALFQRATAADPNDEDYHYNLAIALFRRGDTAGALREADAALKLKPDDQDAGELRARLSVTTPGTRLASLPDTANFTPAERIRRTYSEASFRQAEFQLDELRDARLAMLPPDQRAEGYVTAGRQYLSEGLLPEAEQQFQSALAADPSSASAHAALGQVRELSGDPSGARSEAQSSLSIHANVPALLLLARLDLAANQMSAASSDIARALLLEPTNAEAIALRLSLQERGAAAH